jgi:flagellar hook assembly protein FlgD
VVDYIRQLFTTNRTMDQIFRAAPTFHGHVLGAYASQRTPGLRYELDPESRSSAFYRSLVGDFSMPASLVRATPLASTSLTPPDFVIPGAAQVVDNAGAALFASAAAAANPDGKAAGRLAVGTRLRITAEAAAMPDATRVFAVKAIGGTASGFVRSSGLAPRDSSATVVWSLDQSAAWLSPNGDGNNERFALTVRLSESATASIAIRDAAGHSVWKATQTGDIARFGWDLKTATGAIVKDGAYTWSFTAHDGWGNAGVSRSGSFTVDRTPPVTKPSASSTAGRNGWSISPVTVKLTASDARSGVASTWWRLNSGTARAYKAPLVVSADGTWSFGYRSVDRAGVGEAWHTLTLRIDRTAPVIATSLSGTRSAVPGTWRSAVTIRPAISDATSGIAAKSAAVDGARPVALGASPVVVSGDGAHTVRLDATDAAGNRASVTTTITIDTTPPVVTLPAAPAVPPLVSPNGDGRLDTVRLPYAVSEAGTVKTTVVAPDGKTVVRTVVAAVAAGPQAFVWDGRNNAGVRVPDGRYTVTFTPTDLPGNTGAPASEPVDVYAALSSITATPGLFFPQDGDALAPRTTVAVKLLSPAKVSIIVLDASGHVVRTAFTGKTFAAGTVAWQWNGKADDGKLVPQGRYQMVVTATNGTQTTSLGQPVDAMAFRLAASSASPVRGTPFTLTATSAEPLVAAPVVTVRQPGLAAWSVRMTRLSATRFAITITPRKGGTAGEMSLSVAGVDTARGTNRSVLQLSLR